MRVHLDRLSALATRLYLKMHSEKPSSNSLDLTYYVYEAEKLGYPHSFQAGQFLTVRRNETELGYNFLKSYTDLDGPPSLRLAGDKIHCYKIMHSLQIPTPRYIVAGSWDLQRALKFKGTCPGGIVIKPARDTGDAVGVTIKPETPAGVFRGLQISAAYSPDVLVEQFCEGTNYRLLYCMGKFLAASARMPAIVTGDGIRSVADLISAANSGRRAVGDMPEYSPETRPILYRIPADARIKLALKKRRLSLRSVPRAGQTIQLQEICHWLWGGEYRDITDEVCPTLVADAARLVRALGIKLAGVDVITANVRDCRNGGYVINEVNTTPALLVHYEVQNREKMRPVAQTILQQLLGTPT